MTITERVDRLPQVLKDMRIWSVVEIGKPANDGISRKKMHYNHKRNGTFASYAKVDDLTTWGFVEDVADAIHQWPLTVDVETCLPGIARHGNLLIIDVDWKKREEEGLPETVIDMLKKHPTYAEYSVSGRGVHILYTVDDELDGRNHKLEYEDEGIEIEYFEGNHFCTLTGDRIAEVDGVEMPEDIQHVNEILGKLRAEKIRIAEEAAADNASMNALPSVELLQPHEMNELSDEEILEIIRRTTDTKMQRLWNSVGDSGGSNLDQALCNKLCFYCGNDADRIKRIAFQSSRKRDKWVSHKTYLDGTIQKAITKWDGKLHYMWKKKAESSSSSSNDSFLADRNLNLTDSGYADRYNHLYGNDFLWCEGEKTWYAYEGRYWQRDDELRIISAGEDVARKTILAIVSGTPADDPTRVERIRKAVSRESNSNIRNSAELFKTRVAVTPKKFNNNRWFLNCQNGTVDLRTGELRPFDRQDYMSKIGGVEYDPAANTATDCPMWMKFLNKVFLDDAELISHVQKLVGMTLSGEIRDHTFAILYGDGSNGKTQFIKVLADLMGEYACKMRPETMTPSSFSSAGNATPELAALRGHRLVSCDETESGAVLAESFIKRITGGDTIRARALYQSEMEYTPELTLWLDTNHKPVIARGGHAIWRRIQLIPFLARIPAEEQVPNIATVMIEAEGPAILRWAVEGCLRWQAEGLLPIPRAIEEATAEYRREENKIGRFLEESCVINPSESIPAKRLYKEYQEWCIDQGCHPEQQKKFLQSMREDHGFRTDRQKYGYEVFGVDLRYGVEYGVDNE